MRGWAAAGLGLIAVSGCPEPDTVPGEESTTTAAGPANTESEAGGPVSTSMPNPSTTAPPPPPPPPTTGEDGDGSSSSSDGFPAGPTCSVQEVTEGALVDPLPKGEEPGLFPTIVGEALEDYCGCHTLMNNGQNLKYMFLNAPGGTLFLEYADMGRSFGGGTLGDAIFQQVVGNGAMPPGSCYFPEEPDAILVKWLTDGMPDGSAFVWP